MKRIAGHVGCSCATLPPPPHRHLPCTKMLLAALLAVALKDPSIQSLPHAGLGLNVVGSIGGGRVASLCPSLYPRFCAVCCGKSSPPHVAACLERRLLLKKLHLLVEDGRQEEILTKCNYLLKIDICSLNATLAAAPIKIRITPHLVPRSGGRAVLCEWVPRL